MGLKKKEHHPLRKIKEPLRKIGTLNLILIIVGAFFVWFNWQMLCIYRAYASIPETYACAVIAATIGECGICGWIRTTKDKKQERQWQKQDEIELKKEAEMEENENDT